MTPIKQDSESMTVRQVAELRGVSRQRVYLWLRSGLACSGGNGSGPIRISRQNALRFEPAAEGWKPGRKRAHKLSQRQLERAAAKLAKKPTLKQLARDLGVSPSSLWQQLQTLEKEGAK